MDQEQPTRMIEQGVPTAAKSCPSCGEILEDDHRFCEACGFKLEVAAAASIAPETAEVEEDPLGRLGKLWPLIAIAVVILALLAWWWVYTRAILLD